LEGCGPSSSRNENRIYVVVPNGFTGAFVIKEDSKADEATRTERGCQINIPPTAVCAVKSTAMFFKWHKLTAAYGDGYDLTKYRNGANAVSPLEVQCWEMWNERNSTIWFFVGTQDDYGKVASQHPPLPLGRPEDQ
jgi:hypothetical protein